MPFGTKSNAVHISHFYLRIAGHRLTRVVVVVSVVVGTKLKILVETCFGVHSGSLLSQLLMLIMKTQ